MTILDILTKAAGAPIGKLVSVLEAVKAKAPDLAGEIDDILAALNAAASTESLVARAQALPAEIANIAQGRIDPGGPKVSDLA